MLLHHARENRGQVMAKTAAVRISLAQEGIDLQDADGEIAVELIRPLFVPGELGAEVVQDGFMIAHQQMMPGREPRALPGFENLGPTRRNTQQTRMDSHRLPLRRK